MRDALALGWIAFAFLLYGASPAHAWLDAGEIAAAGAELGVMHPTGVPGFIHLLRASVILPIGSMGFRIAASSAALGAGCVVLVWLLLRRHRVHPAIGWAVCPWVLVSLTFVRQSRLAEIYALGTFLLLFVIWALDPRVLRRRRDRMRMLGTLGATVAAWGFGDLRLALGPLLVVVWVSDLRRGERWVRWAPLMFATASLCLLALPLASARAPITDWGNPETVDALWSHLQASAIREAYAHDMLPASLAMWRHNLGASFDRAVADLGPLGLVLTVGAFVWLCTRGGRPRRRRLVLMVGVVLVIELFYAVGINPMGGPELQTGMMIAPLCAVLVGLAVHGWTERRPGLRWPLGPVLGAALVVPAALASMGDARTTRSWAPHAWTRAALHQLPPGALLLTQTDDLAAGGLYARVHEGARPDAVVIPAQHLYRAPPDHARADPRWDRVWSAARGRPDEATRIVAAIEAHEGPVALEMPGANIFAAVPWWSDRGRLPLGISGGGERPPPPGREVDHWLPRLPATEDRKRLAVALGNRGRALVRARGDAGLEHAQLLLETSLRRVRAEDPAALVAAGAIVDRRGRPDVAIALTREALALEPDREAALVNLARYLSRDPATVDEALALASRAAELRPWNARPWRQLAKIHGLRGEEDLAQKAREHAASAAVPRTGPTWPGQQLPTGETAP